MSWPASDPVERVAVEEIEGDAPIADQGELEGIALAIHRRADSHDPEKLATTAGCRVEFVDDLPRGLDGLLVRGVIFVTRRRDRRRMMVALLHELAHWLLRSVGHSHGDVWCLTLALAAPLCVLRAMRDRGELTVSALYWTTELSAWALRARLRMATVEAAA